MIQVFEIDSISAISAAMRGQIVVSGSHGGRSAAELALAHPPALAVFNDAGIGLDQAGIRGLDILQAHGVAACAVSHLSARIGDAGSTRSSGRISTLNTLAAGAGIAAGMDCETAISFFSKRPLHLG